MAAVERSPEQDRDSSNFAAPPLATLLAELNPKTDLAGLVNRVWRLNLPWVVVPDAAISAWEKRDQAGWAKVKAWLAERNVTIVRI